MATARVSTAGCLGTATCSPAAAARVGPLKLVAGTRCSRLLRNLQCSGRLCLVSASCMRGSVVLWAERMASRSVFRVSTASVSASSFALVMSGGPDCCDSGIGGNGCTAAGGDGFGVGSTGVGVNGFGMARGGSTEGAECWIVCMYVAEDRSDEVCCGVKGNVYAVAG
jgi:hypothetical protein